MDRGLAGVLAICFLASTLVALLFLGLEPTEKVSLIRIEAFKGPLEKLRPYTIELLVREPVDRLAVELSYMVRVDEQTHESLLEVLDPEEVLESSGEALTMMPKVKEILRMMGSFADRPVPKFFRDRAVYEDVLHATVYDLAVLDMRDFMKWVPPSAGPQAYGSYVVFAMLKHEENVSFYQGACDYYLDRCESIGEIAISRAGDSTVYENPSVVVPRDSNYTHVREAPPFGTVIFEDLDAEESVRVHFKTRHLAVPGMLMARIYVDGSVQDTYFTIVDWPEREYA